MSQTSLLNEKFIFPVDFTLLDIETTGLSPLKNEIIELSAIKVRDCEVVDKFSKLVKPSGRINYYITSLTGISDNLVRNADPISVVLPEFVEFLAQDILIGHNVKFDIGFIQANLERNKLLRLVNQTMDTMLISRRFNKLSSHSLSNLAKHYSVSTQGHHRALNDCLITFEIYKKLRAEFS